MVGKNMPFRGGGMMDLHFIYPCNRINQTANLNIFEGPLRLQVVVGPDNEVGGRLPQTGAQPPAPVLAKKPGK